MVFQMEKENIINKESNKRVDSKGNLIKIFDECNNINEMIIQN